MEVEGREGEKEKGFSCRAEVDKLTLDNFIGLYMCTFGMLSRRKWGRRESGKGIEWYSIMYSSRR